MSAVNVFLYSDAAFVMTDGRACHHNGKRAGAATKVFPLPHLNAVVASRGPIHFGHASWAMVNQARSSFDEAKAHLGTDLRILADDFAGRGIGVGAPAAQVHLVGLSDASGEFESWFAVDREEGGAAPFVSIRTGDIFCPWPGACDAETQRLARLSHDDPAAFDPRTHGIALMRGQQRFAPHWVGEFCALTTITRDSISTEILERWLEPVAAAA